MAAPLDRTWYNTLVDDTGDGLTGTIWNKTQVDGLLDTVDASLATVIATPSTQDLTIAKVESRLVLQHTGSTTKARVMAAVVDHAALALNANLAGGAWARDDAAKEGVMVILTPALGFRATKVDAAGVVTALLTVDPTGLVTLNFGQLKFPAVQVPSTDVNVLDDYEEGTWTPVIGGETGQSGQTYATQAGRYQKTGRWVHADFHVQLTAKGTITGAVRIGGLPFPGSGLVTDQVAVPIFYHDLATPVIQVIGLMPPAGSHVALYAPTAANMSILAPGQMPPTMINNGTIFVGSLRYQTPA